MANALVPQSTRRRPSPTTTRTHARRPTHQVTLTPCTRSVAPLTNRLHNAGDEQAVAVVHRHATHAITRTPRRPTRPPSRAPPPPHIAATTCWHADQHPKPTTRPLARPIAPRPNPNARTRPPPRQPEGGTHSWHEEGTQATRPTVRAHPQSQRPNASSAAAVHATLDRPAIHATEDVQSIQLSMLAGPFARPSAPSPNPNAQRPNVRRPYAAADESVHGPVAKCATPPTPNVSQPHRLPRSPNLYPNPNPNLNPN